MIACPHALGLAIPLVVAISTAVSAKAGILVKDRLALERMRTVDTVLFDKTGTLTRGNHAVTGIATADGHDRDHVLAIAAAVEGDTEHPLARAIVTAAGAGHTQGLRLHRAHRPRRGGNRQRAPLRRRWPGPAPPARPHVPAELAATTAGWTERGAAVLHLLDDTSVVAAFALEDEVRPEAAARGRRPPRPRRHPRGDDHR